MEQFTLKKYLADPTRKVVTIGMLHVDIANGAYCHLMQTKNSSVDISLGKTNR